MWSKECEECFDVCFTFGQMNVLMFVCQYFYQTAEWGAGSACEKCGVPFFWNVKEMWAQKTVGVRQVSSVV